MDNAHILAILETASAKEGQGGYWELPEGHSASFYVSRNGAALTVGRVTGVRIAEPLVFLRTARSETFVVAAVDLYAGAVEGTAGPTRKAGFVLFRRRPGRRARRPRTDEGAQHGAEAVLKSAGNALGFLAGDALRIRRREVEARLRARGIPHAADVAGAMYRNLGQGALELLFGETRAAQAVLTDRAEAALPILREGAVVSSAHTGAWDVVACAMAPRLRLTLVTKRLSIRFFDRLWQRTRRDAGVGLLDGPGTVPSALARLARGEVVATMMDQAPRKGLVHPFLGQDALHDTLPAALAQRARRPFVVVLTRRLPSGEHLVDVPFVLHPSRKEGDFVPRATRQASDALGDWVRAHPDQWLWLHRRWKGFEGPAPT
jgi:Kdo2-lipid IVA lauroyltransferase/acyltransferase